MDSVIFDVDGTMWNSTGIVAQAWNEYLKSHSIDIQITDVRLQSLFGQLLPDIAKQIFPDLPEEEQLRLIDGCCEAEHLALSRQCAPIYEGLEDTLRKLCKSFPLFIVSNCQAGYIELFLEKTGFGPYFTGHLCPGDTGEAKAQNIRTLAGKYHLKAPVYVGDTFGDYQACQAAGVPFIFASYGFGNVEHPDYTIQEPAGLLDICAPFAASAPKKGL